MSRRIARTALAAVFLAAATSGTARAQNPEIHVITASATGRVLARPDLGILILEIEASAPLAADAASQCARKASDIGAALAGLGNAAGSFQFSPVVFSRAGGQYYGPNQPTLTGIAAQQYVFVFFEGSVLTDASQLNQKIAATIDALTKSGAGAANPYPQPQAAMVVYTVKDAATYESQALEKALASAREKAQAMAKQLGVEITGLRTVSSNFTYTGYGVDMVGGAIGPYPQVPTNPLQDLPYRFYSTRPDQVPITASANLTYSFR